MVESRVVYAFEGIPEDLPRPPMAALRALLSAGVLLSARAWQDLSLPARQALAQVGAADLLDEARISELLKQVAVANLKLIGKKSDPDANAIPPDLLAALGPVRPLAVKEWRALRAVDRFVLDALVKNTRLLGRAMNELVPARGGIGPGGGSMNAWSGAVARAELRMRRDVAARVVTSDFMDGRAFVFANVAGRRAARRASELLDAQAEATVGPVEIDWGYRAADDTLFWQAHVSAWDGTFFPAAALLAATSAAVAMYDMVRGLDPDAAITIAAIREEPWQAGRQEVHEESTALYKKGHANAVGAAPAATNVKDTLFTGPPKMEGSNTPKDLGGIQRTTLPLAASSTPVLAPLAANHASAQSPGSPPSPYAAMPWAAPPTPPALRPATPAPPAPVTYAPVPTSASTPLPSSSPTPNREVSPARPAWVTALVVTLVVLANVLITVAVVLYVTRRHRGH